MKKFFLYINTLSHMKISQFYYLFIRRVLPQSNKYNVSITLIVNDICLVNLIRRKKINNEENCLEFLNVSKKYLSDSFDWHCLEMPKLWRYNLHYFDYILDSNRNVELSGEFIDSWIKKNPIGCVDAWEPYTVSLRVVNWIKFFLLQGPDKIKQEWLDSLYLQAEWLNNNIEYHILANHYLKNAKALFFAGAYFNCGNSSKWYSCGLKVLLEELDEQIQSDGGHYEKSPMYHTIVLEDYLDVINLINSNKLEIESGKLSHLKYITNKSLDFLNLILMPDGDIPLFNDAAFKIAPTPDEIFKYANDILAYTPIVNGDRITSLDASGYFIIKNHSDMCIVDCGEVSPNYQPGHTHCDLLSFELSLKGERVIVDTGVHDYENGELRKYSRSTQAHNTVQIDGKEQSDLWGQFRVAKRAEVLYANLTESKAGALFEGAYKPYWSGRSGLSHKRSIRNVNNAWQFEDTVLGSGVHDVNSYIHLHPDYKCLYDSGEYIICKKNLKVASLTFSNNLSISIDKGHYFPEFGEDLINEVITFSYSGLLPITLSYCLLT